MTNEDKITVRVKLFAVYQEAYGSPELKLEFPPQSPVGNVLEHLLGQHPELEKWRGITRFGINCHFVESHTPMADGDEVVLIPPVSGG